MESASLGVESCLGDLGFFVPEPFIIFDIIFICQEVFAEKTPLMKDFVPGLNLYGCWNLMLPKGTPPEFQQWYKDNFIPALRSAEVKEQFDKNFIFISPEAHSPEGVRADMARLRQQWQPFARKIKPE